MLRTLVLLLMLSWPVQAASAVAPLFTLPVNTDMTATPIIGTSTVANLPTCNSGTKAILYLVTDALTPVVLSAVTGGGAVNVLVYCNGTNWIVG